ncbi:hypothetical protein Avbf_11157 [Armadillidium vulgare]|nr:hypothetical protein Avbf_11157 [Armadillidium vulgare]
MNLFIVFSLLLVTCISSSRAFFWNFSEPFDQCTYECGFKKFYLNKQTCSIGTDVGICGCCERCLKGVGSSCGGDDGVNGKCGCQFIMQ